MGGRTTGPEFTAASLRKLNGVYFVLRHGESVPSSEGRVCTSLQAGKDPKNGLTQKGRAEVEESAKAWIETNRALILPFLKSGRAVIVSSPFSRTLETARILAETLKSPAPAAPPIPIREDPSLVERGYGDYEGALNAGGIYDKVREEDRKDDNNRKNGVESQADVAARVTRVIAKLEEESLEAGGKLYVLVAHGDPLKILQGAVKGLTPSESSDPARVRHFNTAEFRRLVLSR